MVRPRQSIDIVKNNVENTVKNMNSCEKFTSCNFLKAKTLKQRYFGSCTKDCSSGVSRCVNQNNAKVICACESYGQTACWHRMHEQYSQILHLSTLEMLAAAGRAVPPGPETKITRVTKSHFLS